MTIQSVFFLVPSFILRRLRVPFTGLGEKVARLAPGLSYDLKEIHSDMDSGTYGAAVLLNSLVWAGLVAAFIRLASGSLRASTAPAALTFFVLLIFLITRPRILAGKIAENIDKDLVYALKDLLLQVGSGISLFDAMVHVSQAGYGAISEEFRLTVQDIHAGESTDRALEKMANRTKSEFLRKAVWQMVTALRAGTSIETALKSVIGILENYQKNQIRNYTGELNLYVLMYMVFAVAVPGLGSTILIVLSAFGGARVSESTVLLIIGACFLIQFLIIGFLKSRRPAVHM